MATEKKPIPYTCIRNHHRMITRSKNLIYGPDTSKIMVQLDRYRPDHKYIRLSKVQLTEIPPLPKAVFQLIIEDCPITKLPPIPKQICWLRITNCPLTELSKDLYLSSLDLNGTQIEEIPLYKSLGWLSCDYSPVRKLRQYPNLHSLCFTGTLLKEIPYLPKLNYLVCNAPNLETIAYLPKLGSMQLHNLENNKHIIKKQHTPSSGSILSQIIEEASGTHYIKHLQADEERKRQHKLCKTIKEELMAKIWSI